LQGGLQLELQDFGLRRGFRHGRMWRR
jgi:hypothetical protein